MLQTRKKCKSFAIFNLPTIFSLAFKIYVTPVALQNGYQWLRHATVSAHKFDYKKNGITYELENFIRICM